MLATQPQRLFLVIMCPNRKPPHPTTLMSIALVMEKLRILDCGGMGYPNVRWQ